MANGKIKLRSGRYIYGRQFACAEAPFATPRPERVEIGPPAPFGIPLPSDHPFIGVTDHEIVYKLCSVSSPSSGREIRGGGS